MLHQVKTLTKRFSFFARSLSRHTGLNDHNSPSRTVTFHGSVLNDVMDTRQSFPVPPDFHQFGLSKLDNFIEYSVFEIKMSV